MQRVGISKMDNMNGRPYVTTMFEEKNSLENFIRDLSLENSNDI